MNNKPSTKTQTGFTLVEVLVAVSLIGIIGLIFTNFLAQTFQGANKTQLVGKLKQNGQNALNIIGQTARFSYKVTCVNPTTFDVLALQNQAKNGYTRFWFQAPVAGTSNGAIVQDTVTIEPVDVSQLCDLSQVVPVVATRQYLTDQDPVNGVSVLTGTGAFTHIIGANSDSVTIKFNLGPGINFPQRGVDTQIGASGVLFQTTVVIR